MEGIQDSSYCHLFHLCVDENPMTMKTVSQQSLYVFLVSFCWLLMPNTSCHASCISGWAVQFYSGQDLKGNQYCYRTGNRTAAFAVPPKSLKVKSGYQVQLFYRGHNFQTVVGGTSTNLNAKFDRFYAAPIPPESTSWTDPCLVNLFPQTTYRGSSQCIRGRGYYFYNKLSFKPQSMLLMDGAYIVFYLDEKIVKRAYQKIERISFQYDRFAVGTSPRPRRPKRWRND